jgi:hypothetical protein
MTFPSSSSALQALIGDILSRWPEHKSYLDKSFASRAPDVMRVSETGLIRYVRIIASCAMKSSYQRSCFFGATVDTA